MALAGLPLRADSDFFIGESPGAKLPPTDALGKYKQYVYDVVGSYWYPSVNQHYGIIETGKVRIRYTVHSDGSLTDVTVVEGKNLPLLEKISKQALEAPAPFKPFDAVLLKQVGEKYSDDFTFTTGAQK
jgi:outer membrane biosynthesis protein TonB